MDFGQKILPFLLSESPATFQAGLLGMTYKDPATGYEYQIVKNTDAAALSPGMAVTKEAATAVFEVDKATTAERIYGIVANQLTGTTVAVNDAFWVLRKGVGYGYKGASGCGAIVANAPVVASGGCFEPCTGTVGALSAAAIAHRWNVQALTATATNAAAGTQFLLLIK